jgi:hypothetical protein
MDSTSLRLAYDDLLDAAEAVSIDAPVAPPPGEWDVEQQLAHLVAVDAGVLAAAYAVVSGGQATFDNRDSMDPWTLARVSERTGGSAALVRRIRQQGEALCALVDQLGPGELDQLVPTLLVSGSTLLVDQPIRLGDLISGLADDHLPRHAQQLRVLLPPGVEATAV